MFTTLISTTELAAHLGRGAWAIVDTRFKLDDPAAGRRVYDAGHIAGAVYAHLDDDLAGAVTPDSGRHPLPDPETLVRKLSRWGIGDDTQVVAYDDGSSAIAARLWWLLRWLGHDAAAVLDGGFAAWRAAGLPTNDLEPAPEPRHFTPRVRPQLVASTPDVQASLNAGALKLLDARAPARFRGELEPIDAVAGHVPGAVNHPFERNLDTAGCFLPPAELERCYRASLGGSPARESIAMCGSGVTACHVLLAQMHAGLESGRLYVGSWSEWIRDPARPTATGDV